MANRVATDDRGRDVDNDGERGAQRIEPQEGLTEWQSDWDLNELGPRTRREQGNERNARERCADQHAGRVGKPASERAAGSDNSDRREREQ